MKGLGPLADGARVLIVGGGPGGAICALELLRGARARSRRIEVVILTPTQSRTRCQSVGVLSPPFQQVLRDQLDVVLPPELLQRRIAAYALYGDSSCLRFPLDDAEDAEGTFASPRAELDAFLLSAAEAAGAKILRTHVRDAELGAEQIAVQADLGWLDGDVLVGAFGLEPTLGLALTRRLGYAPPQHLEAVVTTLYPSLGHAGRVPDDTVHAFLPTLNSLEFGALIPRVDHVTVVVAGAHVGATALEEFLALPAVCDLVGSQHERGDQVRGMFPNGLARRAYADRFVCVGDTAGLVRPFKGKGIYAACLTGIRAARTMLDLGISRPAFETYTADCHDLVLDVRYGRLIRILALVLTKRLSLDPVLARAHIDRGLRRALFLAVSGHGSSRDIFWLGARPKTAAGLLGVCARYAWSSNRGQSCCSGSMPCTSTRSAGF